MAALSLDTQILRLKEEVDSLTRQRDRLRRESESYRQIANTAESETEKRRLSYLKLEAKYEEERKARFASEMTLARTHAPDPPIVKPDRRLVDVGVGVSGDFAEKENDPIYGGTSGTKGKCPVTTGHKPCPEEPQHRNKSQGSAGSPDPIDVGACQAGRFTAAGNLGNGHSPAQLQENARHPGPVISNLSLPRQRVCSSNPNPYALHITKRMRPNVCKAPPMMPSPSNDRPRPQPLIICPPKPGDISRYLNDTTHLPIIPPPQRLFISRRALTRTYGLPGMGFLWASKDRHYKFLLPTFEENPQMLGAPGAPGLLLSCRSEICESGPWTLFVRAEGGKPRLNYAGEYKSRVVGKLTGRDFGGQPRSMKESWGRKLSEHKRYSVYRDMRARMTLRKRLGYEPTRSQVWHESELIKAKGYTSDLTWQDVISALEREEERIDIVKLICVSYTRDRAHAYAKAQVEYEHYMIENPPAPRKRKRDDYEEQMYLV